MTDRDRFKQAMLARLVDADITEPEHIEAVLAVTCQALEKQSLFGEAMQGIGKGIGSALSGAANVVGKGLQWGGLGTLGVVGGLGIGSGYLRAKAEALDDETPEELRGEELADRYSTLADAAEARARTLDRSRQKKIRRAGRPLL